MKNIIGTSLVKYEGKFYIFSGEKDIYEVNELGARIYSLCNGLNTEEDICNKLIKVFDVDRDTLKEDISNYIKTLKELILID